MKYQRFRGRRVRKRETAYKSNDILSKHHIVSKSVHISIKNIFIYEIIGNHEFENRNISL